MSIRQMRGYTLAEVLVAMLIATTLMMAVVRLFTKVGETFESNAKALQLIESTRVSLQFVKSDLSQAGYMGCVMTDVDPSGASTDKDLTGMIQTATNLAPLSYWGVAGVDGGSNPDSLSVFYMQDLDIRVLTNDTNAERNGARGMYVDAYKVFDSNGDPVISSGDWVVAASCQNATSFILTNDPVAVSGVSLGFDKDEDGLVDGSVALLEYQTGVNFDGYWNQSLIGSPALPGNYDSSASAGATYIGKYFDVRYVVDDSVIDSGSTQSLFRLVNGKTTSSTNEIVRFVDDFQVEYGVDDDNDGITDRFINSLQNVSDNNKPVQVKVSITIAGGEVKQELVNMVKIRNKGL